MKMNEKKVNQIEDAVSEMVEEWDHDKLKAKCIELYNNYFTSGQASEGEIESLLKEYPQD